MFFIVSALAVISFLLWVVFIDADLVTTFYEILYKVAVSQKSRTDFFKGKVVWITGASSGIGEALAYELAKYGCRLILSARRAPLLEEVKSKCIQIGKDNVEGYKEDDVTVLPFDVLETNEHSSVVEKALKFYSRIDILVNNAGRTQRCTFEEAEVAVIDGILNLDMLCHISLTKQTLPVFISQKSGMIINVNSVAGLVGAPGSTLYCAAKFGLRGFMDALRIEVAKHNINVLTFCPGPVQTNLFANAFTKDIKVPYGQVVELKPTAKSRLLRLTAERCAQVLSVGIAANLKEIWLSKKPVLLFVYIAVYMPSFFLFIASLIGRSFVSSVVRDPDLQKKEQ